MTFKQGGGASRLNPAPNRWADGRGPFYSGYTYLLAKRGKGK